MEESGTSIRDDNPDPPMDTPSSWLCDDNDRPVMEYVHADDREAFRIRVGAAIYERFGKHANGGWMYRRVG
jgi:hypothetical protein